MKFCQLQFRFLGCVLLLLCNNFLMAQRHTPPTLESFFGNGVIDYCIGEPLELFIFGDYPPNDPRDTEYDYEIFRERGGVVQILQYRTSTYTLTIPSSDVQHGDVYYGRAYSYNPTTIDALTNRITVNAVASSTTTLPVNSSTGIFHSTLANNTACPGESFSIFTLGGSKEYTFFNASGIQLAPRSASNSHTITGITTDTQFSVQVHISPVCELTTSLDINFIGLTPGAIGTAQSVCRGETPSALQNVTAATLNKIPIAANATNYYQWESSEDGVNWSVLTGVHTATFQPHAIFQTTAFRRGVVDPTTSSSCRIYSNVVTVTVTPPTGGTLAAQSICLGELPQPISLFGASISSGSTYQWQMSTDNVTFNNIPVTTRQLTFSAGDAWVPTQTSYYRLVFTSGTIASCIATSTAATVAVARVPTIPQVAGPASSQIICAGSAITTVSFAISNTSTVTAEGLNNTGLVLSGPFIDEDFCQGLPGRILVKIFDNNQEGLLFYYNNQQLKVDENQIDESVYTLLVDQPVEEAILQIVNADGCVLEEQINSAIGSPSFTYTSQAFDATQVILAKEEIRFTNTSKAPFIYSEWTFGDNSPIKQVPVLQQPEPITHTYAIAGTYKVNLRIFNNSGCYQDNSQFITIGEGYNIFVPNVFTPNNDGVNDRFRALFSGLLSVDFHIYDHTGNLLYSEQIAEQDPDHIQGIKLEGWDGINAPSSPYYIFTVVGTLYDKSTVVEKTGTFILLK